MEKHNYRSLLSQKQYLKLLVADLISRFGDSLDAIAYSWIMYEITGSESLMALIIGLNYVPTVLLQPFAGAFVDRINKRFIMVITDVMRCVIVALLVLLYTQGRLTAWIIAVLTLCTSTVEAFRIPAGSAMMPLLLESSHYTLGKAASYSSARVSQLLGYAASGALIAWIGSAGVLLIDAATFLASAVLISTIKVKEQRGTKKIGIRQVFSDFKGGLSFLRGSKTVQIISLIGLVINFGLMPLSVFQTPYVVDYLHKDAGVLSYIKILMIVGMMLGAFVTPKLLKVPKGKLCVIAGIGMGLSLVCMHITTLTQQTLFMLSLLTLSMIGVGIGGGILNVVIGGCMMSTVPKEMMGRVSGLNAAIMEASMPIGSFLCSALVLKINIPQIFTLFGICTIVFYIMLYAFRFAQFLNTAEDNAEVG